uniref:SAC3/GANP/THP3 conserved domain-containing protein n=1 Tax=Glossina palpalis gambiensis TaxID=67801 RepID=A0A1B0C7N0_9MUSC
MSENSEGAAATDKNINYKAIHCEKIPELFLNKLEATKHFSKFGTVGRLSYNCTVEYENEQDARIAFREAGNCNGTEFLVSYAVHHDDVTQIQRAEEFIDSEMQLGREVMTIASNRFGVISIPKSLTFCAAIRLNKFLLRQNKRTEQIDVADNVSEMCVNVKAKVTLFDKLKESGSFIRWYDETADLQATMLRTNAIQEYSGTNVDQNYSLNPKIQFDSVLLTAIFYLMHYITDLSGDAQAFFSDWFRFVRSYLPSICKTIAQQKVRSLVALEPLDPYARDHVDKKIDAEKLITCLQFFKPIYHYLCLKNMLYPREMKFLNSPITLNSIDYKFPWALTQLSLFMQKGKEMKKSLTFYNTLQNNSHIRLPARIKSGQVSYFLTRTSNRSRLRLMKTILQPYKSDRALNSLPLSYLTKVLAFENECATINFLKYYYDWQCEKGEVRVRFKDVADGDVKLLISKPSVSNESQYFLGTGHTLNPRESKLPSDSNTFKVPSSKAPKSLRQRRERQQKFLLTHRPIANDNQSSASGLKFGNCRCFEEFQSSYLKDSSSTFDHPMANNMIYNSMATDKKNFDKRDNAFKISNMGSNSFPSFEEWERHKNGDMKEKGRRRKEQRQWQQLKDEKNYHKFTANETVKQVTQMSLKGVQKRIETTSQESNNCFDELLGGFIEDFICQVFAAMRYENLLLRKYCHRWLKFWRKRNGRRQLFDKPSLYMIADDRGHFTKKISRPRQGRNRMVTKPCRADVSCDCSFLHERVNLFALISQHLFSPLPSQGPSIAPSTIKYFKLLISLPAGQEELPGFEIFCNNWLMKHIEGAQTDTGPFLRGIQHNLALCVRKFVGIEARNENGGRSEYAADHNDGIICFVSGRNLESSSRKRLAHLLLVSKNFNRISLAIIAYNCENYDSHSLEQDLGLKHFALVGFIESYKCFGCQLKKREFNFHRLFEEAVNFVASEAHKRNGSDRETLAAQPLLQFISKCLGEAIWLRWLESSNENPIFHKLCCIPERVVGIFNKAIDHLMNIIQEDFNEMPEFPSELNEFVPKLSIDCDAPLGVEYFPVDWKDPQRLIYISHVLESIRLPTIEESYPKDMSKDEVEAWLLNYTIHCLPEEDYYYIVEHAGRADEEFCKQVDLLNEQKIGFISPQMLNYVQIIKYIAFSRIDAVTKKLSDEQLTIPVIYMRTALENYHVLPWWLDLETLDEVTVTRKRAPAPAEIVPQMNRTEASKIGVAHQRPGILHVFIEEQPQPSNRQRRVAPYQKNAHREPRLNETFSQPKSEKVLAGSEKMHERKVQVQGFDVAAPQPLAAPKMDENDGYFVDMRGTVATAMHLINQIDALEERRERPRSPPVPSSNGAFFPFNE